jgi:hypothetical protein
MAIVDVKLSTAGFRGNTMILQAQHNACGQPGFSRWIVLFSESRFSDEPGTGGGRVKHEVWTYSLNDGVVHYMKAAPSFLCMILQEVISHVYDAWCGTIH